MVNSDHWYYGHPPRVLLMRLQSVFQSKGVASLESIVESDKSDKDCPIQRDSSQGQMKNSMSGYFDRRRW